MVFKAPCDKTSAFRLPLPFLSYSTVPKSTLHCSAFDPQTFLMFFYILLFFNALCLCLMLSSCQNSVTFMAPSMSLSPPPPQEACIHAVLGCCESVFSVASCYHVLPVLPFFCRLTSTMKSHVLEDRNCLIHCNVPFHSRHMGVHYTNAKSCVDMCNS